MNKTYIFLILIAQINYLYLSPIENKQRKLNDRTEDIVIIHLNDVHCGLNDTIGYDGFVLYRNELKEKYNYVISVDVGDHAQGGALGAITEGEAIMEIMNQIKFDVITVGNHEFDYGIEQLNKLNSQMTTKYICANFCYKKDKTNFFDNAYKIIEADNIKIAFIGIVTPLTYSKTYISTLKDENGEAKYDLLSDNDELVTTVQRYIDEVRNDKNADYVILLTHIGMNVEDYTSNGLISKLKNVDAVLDGHTHRVYNTTSKDLENKDVYFSQTGTKLANIGELIIKKDGTISTRNIEEVPEPTNQSGAKKISRGNVDRWVDTDMNNFINKLWENHGEKLNYHVGNVDYDLRIRPENSSDSHAIYCRYKECTLGNLVADAFKTVVSADASIVNGGAIRSSLLKGEIKTKDIIEVMPFYNSVYVKEVTGQCILDALEFGVRQMPNAFGGFPQVSGITFNVKNYINSSVVTDSNGMFIKVDGERRVYNVKINGENLDLNKKYNLSCSDFILAGGDGYTMFSDFKVVNESLFADSDALSYHIHSNLNGTVPEMYKNELGRINIVTEEEDEFIEVKKSYDKHLQYYIKNLLLILIYFI